ncbi:hypothetical protein DIPPA_11731 [Diplonema papillatum]|nr:hypothetical protein DIPPA_11731 [Diplonema papillatum]
MKQVMAEYANTKPSGVPLTSTIGKRSGVSYLWTGSTSSQVGSVFCKSLCCATLSGNTGVVVSYWTRSGQGWFDMNLHIMQELLKDVHFISEREAMRHSPASGGMQTVRLRTERDFADSFAKDRNGEQPSKADTQVPHYVFLASCSTDGEPPDTHGIGEVIRPYGCIETGMLAADTTSKEKSPRSSTRSASPLQDAEEKPATLLDVSDIPWIAARAASRALAATRAENREGEEEEAAPGEAVCQHPPDAAPPSPSTASGEQAAADAGALDVLPPAPDQAAGAETQGEEETADGAQSGKVDDLASPPNDSSGGARQVEEDVSGFNGASREEHGSRPEQAVVELPGVDEGGADGEVDWGVVRGWSDAEFDGWARASGIRQVYAGACLRLGLKPNSRFLSRLPGDRARSRAITELDLSLNYFGKAFAAVAALLQYLPSLARLTLNDVSLTNDDVGRLCAACQGLPALAEISLQKNPKVSLASSRALLHLVKANRGLTKVDLRGTDIGPDVCKLVEEQARKNAEGANPAGMP